MMGDQQPHTTTPGRHGNVPVDWVILKVSQRCNLSCSYCYVFRRGDDSWKRRPAIMSEEIVSAVARRIQEHCKEQGHRSVVIELHGGEPLLLGPSRLDRLAQLLKDLCPGVKLDFTLQTNGLLLDSQWLQVFDKHHITFSFSLDGPPTLADQRRVRPDGSGSTAEVLEVVRNLRESDERFNQLNTGALCVINPEANGAELVRWFCNQGFRRFDLLLPDGNYVNPPQEWDGPEAYLEFLIAAFDEWYAMGRQAPKIRKFEHMLRGFMGQRSGLDALGGDIRGMCVVETNGAIRCHTVLPLCGPEFAEDRLNIFDHPLGAHVAYYRLDDIQKPPERCLLCPYYKSCGGGYLPHRFDGQSYNNPSFYCDVLYGLSEHMYECLRRDVPEQLWVPVTASC